MKVIYKYPIEITATQTVVMSMNHKLLHVGEQSGELVLWALVDKDDVKTAITISIYGTGNPASTADYEEYIGTVQMSNGLVWHVYKA